MKHSIATVLAVTALLGAGCAAGPHPQPEEPEPLSVEDILASAPRPEDYSESVTCLHRDAYVEIEVINREFLVFHGRRGKAWLNRLRRPCIGLHPGDALVLDMRDSRLCDLDTVSGTKPLGGSFERTSARCSLGKFETISPEQAAALKEGLSR